MGSQSTTSVNDLLRISRMQVTNAIYGHIPILGLRGGGSDTKRKEARKRRFRQHLSGASPSTRPRKKQKEDAIRSESSERGSTTNREDVNHGTELHQPQYIQDESSKSHRFIVFIGTQGVKSVASNH
jgi:hypothetical protein